jgi:two-component system, response regulator YesN
MKMNWYYRMMLSYTPIFFVVISSIIFIFFLVLNNASENKYIETNEAILKRMVYNTDANLMLIERNMVSQLLMDQSIQDFFSNRSKTTYEYYEMQKKLIELKSTLPFLNTIYMFKAAEDRIITDSGAYTLGSFEDKHFIVEQYTKEHNGTWTEPRPFATLSTDEFNQKVVSLVKFYYEGNAKRGAIVVNVYVNSIIDYLNSFNASDNNLVKLVGATKDNALAGRQSAEEPSISVRSEYTGWKYVTSGTNETGYNTLSLVSNVWIIIIIILIVLALAGFTIVTHMHYKPIQSIMEKVGQFSTRKGEELGLKITKDEFKFIEVALDHLLKRSMDYESLHKEDSLLRQQRLFYELLAGHQLLSDRQFQEQLMALKLPYQYDRLAVIVAEIDHYPSFTDKYELRDQHLLKFIIENAFHDLSQQNNLFVWHAWMEPRRIAFVIHHFKSGQTKTVMTLAEEFQRWIHNNLELTVSIGIGADSNSIESIAESYRNAKENVDLKTIFGTNTLIDNRRSAGKLSLDSYAYLQALESAAQSFRMNESDWRQKLTQIFTQLKDMRFVKQEMKVFINSFRIQMDKAIATLSLDLQSTWKQQFLPTLAEIQDRPETLDELSEQLMALMTGFEAAVEEERQARRHHNIALQAKSYIDANYSNIDLSLTRVSEYLKLQPSTLSQLFKEEIGEKFIDYVLKVRLDHAKRLLLETDEPIQSIAEQVGYQNVVSFYRVFKKVQDVPPGEYRTMYRGVNSVSSIRKGEGEGS